MIKEYMPENSLKNPSYYKTLFLKIKYFHGLWFDQKLCKQT